MCLTSRRADDEDGEGDNDDAEAIGTKLFQIRTGLCFPFSVKLELAFSLRLRKLADNYYKRLHHQHQLARGQGQGHPYRGGESYTGRFSRFASTSETKTERELENARSLFLQEAPLRKFRRLRENYEAEKLHTYTCTEGTSEEHAFRIDPFRVAGGTVG